MSSRISIIMFSLTVALGVGCHSADGQPDGSFKTKSHKKRAMHRHGVGPHGGIVFDLGKYHAEFVLDSTTGACQLYILDDDEESPLAVAVKELVLTVQSGKKNDDKSLPQTSVQLRPIHEQEGKATQLTGREPGLTDITMFQGTIAGEIEGKPSLGRFEWGKRSK